MIRVIATLKTGFAFTHPTTHQLLRYFFFYLFNHLILTLSLILTKEKVKFKAGAFADDVGVVCRGNTNSVQGVFTQYEKLTKKSGLFLDADKTEILNLENNVEKVYEVKYMGNKVKITTIKEVKVCIAMTR